jgi:hypothetical protein
MDTATIGVTQKHHLASPLTHDIIADTVTLLFSTVIVLLVVWVLRAVNRMLSSINEKL